MRAQTLSLSLSLSISLCWMEMLRWNWGHTTRIDLIYKVVHKHADGGKSCSESKANVRWGQRVYAFLISGTSSLILRFRFAIVVFLQLFFSYICSSLSSSFPSAGKFTYRLHSYSLKSCSTPFPSRSLTLSLFPHSCFYITVPPKIPNPWKMLCAHEQKPWAAQ